jgi:ABC-type polysaccharide/polyol phosphate export permease
MSVYAELLHHRELFANLFRRDFRSKYKGSFLGVMWSLVNPLVLMGIYTLVFSVLFPVSQIHHYPLYLLSGLAVWVFLSGALATSTRSLVDNANLIKKVRFPRQLTAFSTVATYLVSLAAILIILIPVNLILIPGTRETIWLTIPLIVPVIALVAGLALAAAAANVVFRDVEHIVAALLLPWFFLTPIMYSFEEGGILKGPIENHPTLVQFLHYGNPITPPIEAVHDVLFWGRLPALGDVIYTLGAAAVALALGAWIFRRVDDRIAVEL